MVNLRAIGLGQLEHQFGKEVGNFGMLVIIEFWVDVINLLSLQLVGRFLFGFHIEQLAIPVFQVGGVGTDASINVNVHVGVNVTIGTDKDVLFKPVKQLDEVQQGHGLVDVGNGIFICPWGHEQGALRQGVSLDMLQSLKQVVADVFTLDEWPGSQVHWRVSILLNFVQQLNGIFLLFINAILWQQVTVLLDCLW